MPALRKIFIALCGLLILAGLLILGQRLLISPEALQRLAQKQLTKIFEPRSVSIQRSSLTFRGDAACEGVKISERRGFPPGLFLEIPRARFRVSLLSLLKGRPALTGIFLENPKIRFVRKNGIWNVSDLLARAAPRKGNPKYEKDEVFPAILLSQASLRILFEEKPSRALILSGKMQREYLGFSADGSLRDASALQNNLSFEVSLKEEISVSLHTRALWLGAYQSLWPADFPRIDGTLRGKIQILLPRGREALLPKSMEGSVSLSEGSLLEKGAPLVGKIEATLRFLGDSLELSARAHAGEGTLRLKGQIASLFKNPQISAQIEGAALKPAEWHKDLEAFREMGSGSLALSGSLENPQFKGQWRQKRFNGFPGLALSNCSLRFQAHLTQSHFSSWEITSALADFPGGKVFLKAVREEGETSGSFSLRAHDLQAYQKHLKGAAFLSGQFRDAGGRMEKLTARLHIPDLSWEGVSLKGFKALGEISNGKLTVNGKDTLGHRLQIEGFYDAKGGRLKEASFFFPQEGKVTLSGAWQKDFTGLSLEVLAREMSLNLFRGWKSRFPDAPGRWDFSAKILGSLKAPKLSGRLRTTPLDIFGQKISWMADVFWEKGLMRFKLFEPFRRVVLEGGLILQEPTPKIEAALMLKRAPLEMLAGIIGEQAQKAKGQITAQLKLTGPLASPTLEGNVQASGISWDGGIANEIAASFLWKDQTLTLAEAWMRLGQGRGRLYARGDINFRRENPEGDLDGRLEGWRWRGIAASGNWSVSAKGGEFRIHSPALKISEWSAPLEALLQKKGALWRLKDLRWGTLSARGEWNPGRVEGKIIWNNLFAHDLLRAMGLPSTNGLQTYTRGLIDMEGAISESPENPPENIKIAFKIKSRNLEIAEEAAVLYAEGFLEKGGLMMTRANLRLLKGGSAQASGKLSQGEAAIFEDFRLGLSEFPVFALSPWIPEVKQMKAVKIAQASFALQGPLMNPVIRGGLRAESFQMAGFNLSRASGTFEIAGGTVSLQGSLWTAEGAELRLRPGSILWRDPLGVAFSLKTFIGNLRLPGVSLTGDMDAEGRMIPPPPAKAAATDFRGGGVVEATLRARRLLANEFLFEETETFIRLQGERIEFSPGSSRKSTLMGALERHGEEWRLEKVAWRDSTGARRMGLSGTLGRKEMDLSMEGFHQPLESLLEAAGLKFPGRGMCNFSIRASGSISDPLVSASLTAANGNLLGMAFDHASLLIQMREGTLFLKEMRASQKGAFFLEGKGEIPFGKGKMIGEADKPLWLSVQLYQADLGALAPSIPFVKSGQGSVSAAISLSGTRRAPRLSGTLRLDAKRLEMADILKEVSDLQVEIRAAGREITLERFEGRVGTSRLEVSGGFFIAEDFLPEKIDLRLSLSEPGAPMSVALLGIPQSPGVKRIFSRVDINRALPTVPSTALAVGQGRIQGDARALALSGRFTLSNARFTYPPTRKREEETDLAFLEGATWDVWLVSGKKVRYQNEFASVEAQGSVHLYGKGSSPDVSGKMTALRGEIAYLQKSFEIREAVMDIVENRIHLQGRAEADVSVYDQRTGEYLPDRIEIILEKQDITDGEFRPRFASRTNPSLSEEALAQAALGLNPKTRAEGREEAVRFMNLTVTTPFIASLVKRTGLDFSVKNEPKAQPLPQSARTEPGTFSETLRGTFVNKQYRFGLPITPSLTGIYGVSVDEDKNKLDLRQKVELNYRLSYGLFLKTIYELTQNNPNPDRGIFLGYLMRFGSTPKPKKEVGR